MLCQRDGECAGGGNGYLQPTEGRPHEDNETIRQCCSQCVIGREPALEVVFGGVSEACRFARLITESSCHGLALSYGLLPTMFQTSHHEIGDISFSWSGMKRWLVTSASNDSYADIFGFRQSIPYRTTIERI